MTTGSILMKQLIFEGVFVRLFKSTLYLSIKIEFIDRCITESRTPINKNKSEEIKIKFYFFSEQNYKRILIHLPWILSELF